MAKARKSKTEPIVEEVKEEIKVVVEETKEEPIVEEVVEETKTESLDTEDVLIEEKPLEMISSDKLTPIFTMDISNFGVKQDDAEHFVKNAIMFYYENKDKSFNEEKNEDDAIIKINEKISKFEKQLMRYNYLPKKVVVDFIKDLKQK